MLLEVGILEGKVWLFTAESNMPLPQPVFADDVLVFARLRINHKKLLSLFLQGLHSSLAFKQI